MICFYCKSGGHDTHSATDCECDDPQHQAVKAVGKDAKRHPRRARYGDPVTSHKAAASREGKSEREEAIWQALKRLGPDGGTGYDVAPLAGLTQVQVMRSMYILVDMQWAEYTGRDRQSGPHGTWCCIWRATDPTEARKQAQAVPSTTSRDQPYHRCTG